MDCPCIGISTNIVLVKKGFGQFNVDVIRDLLQHVDIWLTDALGLPHFSSKLVAVLNGENEPSLCDVNAFHFIFLITEGNYWCQWVYQFAHEYCHHLIEGKGDQELRGLGWFEETVCELSSMYCLGKMITLCNHHTNQSLRRFAPSVRDYLDDLLRCESEYAPLHLYIRRNLPLLEKPELHREIYRCIARLMLPLFAECPALWKIILHFGNMSEWNSLTLLFDHLKEEADTTYADQLQRLRVLLLGS